MFFPDEGYEYFDLRDVEKNKLISALSYIWFLFFLPLFFSPNSRYGRFHANQALLLLITSHVGSFFLSFIPIIGGLASGLFNIIVVLLTISGIANALMGRAREIPFVGHIRLLR